VTPCPREASWRAIASPMPAEAPVTRAVPEAEGGGSATPAGYTSPPAEPGH
jgi:hypothetical protein